MREQVWAGGFRIDGLADPETAYRDAREAHGYATAELSEADNPNRVYNLTAERNRMAQIAWAIKRHYGL